MTIVSVLKKLGTVSLSVLLLMPVAGNAFADLFSTTLNTLPITIQKVSSGSIIGQALTNWVNTSLRVGNNGAWGETGMSMDTSRLTSLSYYEGGQQYSVYGLNDYIGFVMNVRATGSGLFCSPDSGIVPMQGDGTGVGGLHNGCAQGSVRFSYNVKFISIADNIPAGQMNVPELYVGTPRLDGFFGHDSPRTSMGAFSVEYTATGCEVSASPSVVSMGVISASRFDAVGDAVAGTPVTVNLQCTDPNMGIYVTMTDENDPGNSSPTLSLTQTGNPATGVGVQFVKQDGSLVTYGPSSSFVDATSSAQWQIKSNTTISANPSFVLIPQYVKTNTSITSGEANALVSVTLAYD
jgi:type 1 fimbria pilin